jgi:hypothetical protein
VRRYSRRIGLYSIRTAHSTVLTRSTTMGKIRKDAREAKKQPTLTPKEKKAAKQAKKHASDIVPFIPH